MRCALCVVHVVRCALCVVRRASCVVRHKSCVARHKSCVARSTCGIGRWALTHQPEVTFRPCFWLTLTPFLPSISGRKLLRLCSKVGGGGGGGGGTGREEAAEVLALSTSVRQISTPKSQLPNLMITDRLPRTNTHHRPRKDTHVPTFIGTYLIPFGMASSSATHTKLSTSRSMVMNVCLHDSMSAVTNKICNDRRKE